MGGGNPQINLYLLMIKLCSYNIRGLNKQLKQADDSSFLADNCISFVGLVETRVKSPKANSVVNSINHQWHWVFNYDFHSNGRIWVGWNPNDWNVSILFKSAQILRLVAPVNNVPISFFVSIIYGFNKIGQRKQLWTDLQMLANSIQGQWCVLGDFNMIKNLEETAGGDDSWDSD